MGVGNGVRTLGVCDLTFPARASDPWTLPMIAVLQENVWLFALSVRKWNIGCLCGGRVVSFWDFGGGIWIADSVEGWESLVERPTMGASKEE